MLHYHRVPVLPAYTRGVIRKHKTNFGVSSHLLAQSRVAQASVMEFSSSALVRASLLLFTAALLVGAEDPEVYYDSVSRRYCTYIYCAKAAIVPTTRRLVLQMRCVTCAGFSLALLCLSADSADHK